jgi:hypothetical protein
MVSSGLLRRVALVRTDVSEEPGASFIWVTTIGELGTTQAATSNRRNNPENTIRHSHRRENLKSYIESTALPKLGLFSSLDERKKTPAPLGPLERVSPVFHVRPF